MSRVDVHPEDVIDAIRRGDRRDERRIEEHVRHCSTCEVELDAMADFDAELAARPDDDERLARLVSGAMDELHPARESIPVPGEGIRTARRAIAVAAAAALVVGLLGGAAAAMWAMSVFESDDEPAPSQQPAPQTRSDRSRQDRPAPAPIEVAPATDEAPPPEEAVVPAPVEAGESRELAPPSAADLLAQANRARNAGDNAEAARLYRALQRAHPSSREAGISRVAFGRLLLNRLNDPAGALAQFDRYLRSGAAGVLAEEARVGRAMALERLGRSAEARAAWQDVVTHHPGSPNAERARERLQ